MFQRRQVSVSGQPTTYALYEPVPRSADPLPLILFLHGAGESGTDALLPTTVGLGPAVQRAPEDWPALIVFPQASQGYGWRGFNLRAAIAALDDVERTYPTDRDRVYVTGISMGGYGAWLTALLHPERFAAAVPVCGGVDAVAAVRAHALRDASVTAARDLATQAARKLVAVPQWVFHGDADNIIPVEESRVMVTALRHEGADVRYTEYAGVRHNSWDPAYAEPGLPKWLFAQRRSLQRV